MVTAMVALMMTVVLVGCGGDDGAGGYAIDGQVRDVLTGGDCTADTESDPGREHVPDPSHSVNPPAGGEHFGDRIAFPGTYSPDETPPDGEIVHSLEHGFVVLWHQPGLPEAQLSQLRQIHEDDPGGILVVPREGLEVPVAVTSWHRRLLCPEGFEEEPVTAFLENFRGDAPESGDPPFFPD
ncbi:MAG: DUF3105 domain-containing protein [Acidimicrobiia bacterium]